MRNLQRPLLPLRFPLRSFLPILLFLTSMSPTANAQEGPVAKEVLKSTADPHTPALQGRSAHYGTSRQLRHEHHG